VKIKGYYSVGKDFENNYFSLGARNYDPETGRFLSCDPLFEKFDKFTPYHYAYNSPVQFKDPSGLSAEDEKGEKV
jgi:RHS repeat-associated protein